MDGAPITTGAEGTEKERQRAEQQRQRADQEHQRADQESERIETVNKAMAMQKALELVQKTYHKLYL